MTGYLIANIKSPLEVKIGDTITSVRQSSRRNQLPGFKQITPMVYSGIYPIDTSELRATQSRPVQAPD